MNLINKYINITSYCIAKLLFDYIIYLRFTDESIGKTFMQYYLDDGDYIPETFIFNLINKYNICGYELCSIGDEGHCSFYVKNCNKCCDDKNCIIINNKESAIEIALALRYLIMNNKRCF